MHLLQFCTFLPMLVFLLQIQQPQAMPRELGLRLEEALAKPENDAMFNEINNDVESDYIDSVVNRAFFDGFKEKMPPFLATIATTSTTTSTTPTTEMPETTAETTTETSSEEDAETQNSDGVFKRSFITILETLLRIRNLFNLVE